MRVGLGLSKFRGELVAWCGDAVTARRIHSMPRSEGFVGVPVADSDAVDGADVAFAAGGRLPKRPQGRATRHH